MLAYLKKQIRGLLKVELVRFCIVGGLGFVINFILLTVLHKSLRIDIFLAQLISAEIALFSNFLLHHHWTYKAHNVTKSKKSLILQFHATSWPAIVGSTLMVGFGEKALHFDNLLALTLSSIIVLSWNFVWTKFVVWRNVAVTPVKEGA